MEELGVGVLCFTGHKSLMGPMGIGGMYVREGVEIRHTRAGGTGVRSVQRHHLDEYPYRMEYGTPNLPGHRRPERRREVGPRARAWRRSTAARWRSGRGFATACGRSRA